MEAAFYALLFFGFMAAVMVSAVRFARNTRRDGRSFGISPFGYTPRGNRMKVHPRIPEPLEPGDYIPHERLNSDDF